MQHAVKLRSGAGQIKTTKQNRSTCRSKQNGYLASAMLLEVPEPGSLSYGENGKEEQHQH